MKFLENLYLLKRVEKRQISKFLDLFLHVTEDTDFGN